MYFKIPYIVLLGFNNFNFFWEPMGISTRTFLPLSTSACINADATSPCFDLNYNNTSKISLKQKLFHCTTRA